MVNFISGMIEKYAKNSLESGQDLYRKYFIKTTIYQRYKAGVDEILTADGFEDVIITR